MFECNEPHLRTSSEVPGFSPARAARAKTRALRNQLVAISLVILAALPHAQAPQPLTTITGRVISEATGDPVRRAYVIAHGPGTKTTRVTMSDDEGRFTFEGLPSDQYRVGAERKPYLSSVAEVMGGTVVVSLADGAIVSGLVVDQTGLPTAGVTLTATSPALPSPRSTRTNLRGEYRFHSLPSGGYTIGPVNQKGESRLLTVAPGIEHHVPTLAVEAPGSRASVGGDGTEGTGVVGGVALDASSNIPLPGVSISLAQSMRTAITDGNGRFEFRGLGATTYGFRIQHAGYASISSAELTLGQNARVHDVTLRGGRHGSIAGTIRDDGGDPVVDADVRAFRKTALDFRPMLIPAETHRTDDRGAFHIENLPPGDYILCACGTDPLPVSLRLLRQLGPTAPDAAAVAEMISDVVPSFPPTYYPGVPRGTDSLVVAVGLSDDRLGIDISMTPVRRFSIRGQLLEDGRTPAQAMQLYLMQDGDLPGGIGVSEMKPMKLEEDGRFLFAGVPPGTYGVGAIPRAQNLAGPWAFAEIVVADRDVNDVILPLGSGLTVTGRVDFSGTATRPHRDALAKTRVSLVPLEFTTRLLVSMATSSRVGYGASLDEDGRFTADNLFPGRYLVRTAVSGSPWRTVQRVSSHDASAVDNVLTVGAGGASDVLVVLSDEPLAAITGTASLERYEPPSSARAVVFPMDPTKWLAPFRFSSQFQWQRIAGDRSFRVSDLPAGDYYAVLVPESDFEMSSARLERWSKTAQRVTLRAGATTTVTLRR